MSRGAHSAAVSEPGLAEPPPAPAAAEQRARLLAATVATVAERGHGAATAEQIAAAAGLPREVLERHFCGKEDCFLAAYDDAVLRLGVGIREALARRGGWPRGVRTAVEATLGMIAADPRLARFCGAEPLVAGPRAFERHRGTVRLLAEPLRRAGRAHCAWGAKLPDRLEETLVSGAIWSIVGQARTGDGERLPELAPELTYFLLTPYLDVAEARRLAGEE